MVANIAFNPNITTVSAGMFNTSSVGLVQGTAYPDPAIRYKLAGGTLASTETLPMWGGVGIYTDVPASPAVRRHRSGPWLAAPPRWPTWWRSACSTRLTA